MLSAGAGASFGTPAGPRAVMEAAAGASPVDVSPSEVAAAPDTDDQMLARHLPAGVETMIWLPLPHLSLLRLLPLPL